MTLNGDESNYINAIKISLKRNLILSDLPYVNWISLKSMLDVERVQWC